MTGSAVTPEACGEHNVNNKKGREKNTHERRAAVPHRAAQHT
jgi:hypothetical protein